MTDKPFIEGDRVSLARWDETVPPPRKMGMCRVVSLRESRSESGWMVVVQAGPEHGSRWHELDANWMEKAE